MTSLTLTGTLTAAAGDDRTVTGLVLPYGEVGRTNRGKVLVSPGAVTMPTDPAAVRLNLGHDRDRPVGRGVSFRETPTGIEGTFTVARTPAGDQLLAEAAEGMRTGLSVELSGIGIRAGKLLAGALDWVGAVVDSAFPSAQLTAADAGELADSVYVPPEEESSTETTETYTDPETGESVTVTTRRTTSTTVTTDAEPKTDDDPKDDTVPAAAPAELTAGRATAGKGTATAAAPTASPADLYKLMADAAGGRNRGGADTLLAALADVTEAQIGSTEQTGWLGQLWSGKAYQRKFVPLLNTGTLTSWKARGWKWTTKPEVAAYAGNKTAIPTNVIGTEPVEVEAERLAGGHDVDRKYRDFSSPEFWAAYFEAMTESYAKKSDLAALAAIIAAAPSFTPGAVPTGVVPAHALLVDAALELIDFATPTFAVVGKGIWRDLLLTPKEQILELLSSQLGLEGGSTLGFTIVPTGAVPAQQIIVGAREALTFSELPGVPIRVEAEDIARGGIDEALFGYFATLVNDDQGLVEGTLGTPEIVTP